MCKANSTIQDDRWAMYLGAGPESTACLNCRHFYKHYSRDAELLFFGHCVYPRMKHRRITDECGYFERRAMVQRSETGSAC